MPKLLLLAAACGPKAVDDTSAAGDTSRAADSLDVAVCAPETATFAEVIDNPWLPLSVGRVQVLQGSEGGDPVRVQVSVLDETQIVAGVTTRVIEEREWEDDELVEVSRNFFVQTTGGTVCYFGEDVDEYEGGEVVSHGGAWRAGTDGAAPGILMPADPAPGQSFQQEVAPGVAEDTGEITAMGDSLDTPAGTFTDTLTVRESSPLDAGVSIKVYARGVGMIYDNGVELSEDSGL